MWIIQNSYYNASNTTSDNASTSRSLQAFFNEIPFLLCLLYSGHDLKILKWRILNCGSHQSDPLFWKGHPQIESVINLVIEQSRGFFKHLLKTYSSKRGFDFSDKIQQLGSCYGESQALIEEGLKTPGLHPLELMQTLKDNPRRIYYLQMLEMIRGYYFSNQEYIKIKELDTYDAYRNFTFDSKKTSKIHKKIEKLLLKEFNSSILFRRWQEGAGEAHSFMSHASSKTKKFWFYNSFGVGLYQFEKIEGLARAVLEQLENLLCVSGNSKCVYYIQIYRHA